jgi:hypothetical protein
VLQGMDQPKNGNFSPHSRSPPQGLRHAGHKSGKAAHNG